MISVFPGNVHRLFATALVGLIICGSTTSCADRGVNAAAGAAAMAPFYALVAPWYLAGVTSDYLHQEAFQRQMEQQRANPERIPAAVTRSIAAQTGFTAETLEQLLVVTGLTPHQQHVPILFFGTVDQEMWVYYRSDAALNARFDPIARRIVGPIRNFIAMIPTEKTPQR